jgi:hypothetical protein
LPAPVCNELERAVATGLCSAAALGIVDSAGVQHLTYYGHTCGEIGESETGRRSSARLPVGPSTLFDLASLTKPMVIVSLIAQDLSSSAPRIELDMPRERRPGRTSMLRPPLSRRNNGVLR